LNLAGFTKVLASAIFVSGRDSADAVNNSGNLFMDEELRQGITEIVIDREHGEVRVTLGDTLTKVARYFGDQGCVLIPDGEQSVHFEPMALETRLPDATTQDWPMGDRVPIDLLPQHDDQKLREAVDLVFADPDFRTAAFLVVHKGFLIAERYGPGVNRDTQLESWSMGKSLTALLVGVLVEQGELELGQRAPVPEWQRGGDPRGEITVTDLLRMSSGLHFTGHHDPDYSPESGYPDHFYVYTGAIDVFDWSINKPLQAPPNTVGRYHNCDPLILGAICKRIVSERGEEYLAFPQRDLFDRIGIRKQILEPDPYGNFLLTGFDYGTGRNWARLGLLCLQDGMFGGERILPEGWIEFVSSPAPAWEEPVYGGLFWLNGTGNWNLPTDAYYMAGAGGQLVFAVPTHDVVIVRMGHTRGDGPEMREALRQAQGLILEAVEPPSPN
jgi:CubicO group peptidase (beta-lactamase class C family)